jgi:surface antigen
MQTRYFMRTFGTSLRTFFKVHRIAKLPLTLIVCLMLASALLSVSALHAEAQVWPICKSGDIFYQIRAGDTLNLIAVRYKTTWAVLATYNHIINPNLIYANAILCIPQSKHTQNMNTSTSPTDNTASDSNDGQWAWANASNLDGNIPPGVMIGTGNYFPLGQCTWWASERYYQLTGIYVPWTTNSDAWQWTARAQDFGWHVSNIPEVGDIMDMQPYVQGASSLGHVAVVEQVLSNGDVIASSMNWGTTPQQAQHVTEFEFTPGPGITFISI